MNRRLRILHLEDNRNDAELVQSMMFAGGFACDITLVQTRNEFAQNVEQKEFDLILSDFSLPSFDGLSASRLAREKVPDIPFILVSGTIGEDAAIDSLLGGATDYVLKTKLSRLVPAVRRALHEAENERERKRAEEELHKLWSAVEQSVNCIYITNREGIIEYVNPGFTKTTGYSKEDVIGKTPRILKSGKHGNEFYKRLWKTLLAGEVAYAEFINKKKNGELVYQEETITPVKDLKGNIAHFIATGRDVTERKRAEEGLKLFRTLIDRSNDAIEVVDPKTGRFLDVNEKASLDLGYSREELLALSIFDIDPTVDKSSFTSTMEELQKSSVLLWEGIHRRRDGSRFPVEVNISYVQLDREYVVTVVRDITERKRVEEASRKSEELHRLVIENINEIIYRIPLNDNQFSGKPQFVSPRVKEILGYDPHEFLEDPGLWLRVVHPDDVPSLTRSTQELLANRVSGTWEYRLKHKTTDEYRWMEDHVVPVFDDQGKLMGMQGVARDVTAQKKADETVHQSALQVVHARRTKVIRELIIIFAMSIVVLVAAHYLNAFETLSALVLAYKETAVDELVTTVIFLAFLFLVFFYRRWHEVKAEIVERKIVEDALRIMHGELDLRVQQRTAELTKTVEELHAEVAERKQAEKQISMLAHAVRSIGECVSITDMDDKLLFVNEAFLRTYGYDERELLGKHIGIVRSPNNLQEVVRDILPATLRGGWRGEIMNRRKDGSEFPMSLSTSVVRDAKGQLVGLIGVATDITERKRAEETLKRSEEKYRSLVSNINDGFFITDAEGNITFANDALAKIQGYKSKDNIIGKHFSDFIPLGLMGKMVEQRRRSLETGEMVMLEVPMIKADGTTGFVELKPSPLIEGDKIIGDMGVIRDVTERKRLEDQIRQVQKMESIGTLAGGIAHDFNNILGIILAYATSIERNKNDAMKLGETVDTIVRATRRGAALVRQILTFARKTDLEMSAVDVNNVVTEVMNMIVDTFPKVIIYSRDLEKDLPVLYADHSQLHQVVLNLCVNARDAMPNGGELSVKTSGVAGTRVRDRFPDARASEYVLIEVADTGVGMSEETRERIFEPFYTTKEVGKGTGLGLAVVFGVVKSHKGYVQVESEIGKGTTFRVYLPVPTSTVSSALELVSDEKEVPGGSETLLIVEDEEMLLHALCTMLIEKGYKVISAADGMQAVRLYIEHRDEIALVLTDLGLPKMTGTDEFKRIKQINPKARIIVATGYLEPEMKSELLKAGAALFLSKPYNPTEVLKSIRDILDMP